MYLAIVLGWHVDVEYNIIKQISINAISTSYSNQKKKKILIIKYKKHPHNTTVCSN